MSKKIQPISGVDSSTNPTEVRPLAASATGHLLVDIAGMTIENVTVSDVGQGAPNSLANAWPVKISDGTNILGTPSNPLVISDGSSSITIDNATLSVVGGGTEATAQRVTIASDSTGVLSVDDNGSSLTVDASSWPLPTGAATAALQLPNSHDVTIDNASGVNAVNIQDGNNSITVDGPLTDAELRTSPVAVTLPSTRISYAASTDSYTPATNPTDTWTITGSATKVVKIWSIVFSGVQSTANTEPFLLLKRSAVNTGGTSSVVTSVPIDSVNPTATAVVRSYTANPTLGTLVGAIDSRRVLIPAASTNTIQTASIWSWTYGDDDGGQVQPITLRGTSEVLAINLSGTSLTGASLFTVSVIFTEE